MKFMHSIAALSVIAVAAPATPAIAKPGHANPGARQHAGIGCPPGLAKKQNGCLPPGQAKKLGIGDRLPNYLSRYNVPDRYRDRYYDTRDYSYRYEDNNIYRVNRRSAIIEDIISVLGF